MIDIFNTCQIDCSGDACAGDVILFEEGVFGGSRFNPTFLGKRRIVARILKDSYGAKSQQHTFSLSVLASDGVDALNVGKKTIRKGRNIYRNGTKRQAWQNEADRRVVIRDKHMRGDAARAARDERRLTEV